MNKNIFKEIYTKLKEIKNAYHIAEKTKNEESKEIARENYKNFMSELENQGDSIITIFNMYEQSKDCGNKYIDLHDVINDENVEKLIENLRKNGIEYFTFSSTWSSAVNTAWLFKKNGCSLEGMAEINTNHKDFHTGEYKRIPSYLFKVN